MTPLPSARTRKTDDLDLDLELPALDGVDGDEEGGASFDDPLGTEGREEHDKGAYDDATGEDRPLDDLAFTEGKETGWLVDAEGAAHLDIGGYDLALGDEGAKVLGDDEPDPSVRAHDDFITTDEAAVDDAGEEGPLDEDEELREQDLPALDADDEGDVPDELLFDRALLSTVAAEDLRWADRAWERVAELAPAAAEEPDDSGFLAVPSDDASARDAAWKKLDEGGRVTAAAVVPGGSVVLALPSGEKALLVRVLPDGETRILAEIEAADEKAVVATLRWDASAGQLVATGNFGVEAYRPA